MARAAGTSGSIQPKGVLPAFAATLTATPLTDRSKNGMRGSPPTSLSPITRHPAAVGQKSLPPPRGRIRPNPSSGGAHSTAFEGHPRLAPAVPDIKPKRCGQDDAGSQKSVNHLP